MLTPDETAVALKALLAEPRLKHAGRRAMLDVVEFVATQRPPQLVPARRALQATASAVIVLEGSVALGTRGRGRILRAGDAWVHDLLSGDASLMVRALGTVPARILVLVSGDLARAAFHAQRRHRHRGLPAVNWVRGLIVLTDIQRRRVHPLPPGPAAVGAGHVHGPDFHPWRVQRPVSRSA